MTKLTFFVLRVIILLLLADMRTKQYGDEGHAISFEVVRKNDLSRKNGIEIDLYDCLRESDSVSTLVARRYSKDAVCVIIHLRLFVCMIKMFRIKKRKLEKRPIKGNVFLSVIWPAVFDLKCGSKIHGNQFCLCIYLESNKSDIRKHMTRMDKE